jgi:hypothetical protein
MDVVLVHNVPLLLQPLTQSQVGRAVFVGNCTSHKTFTGTLTNEGSDGRYFFTSVLFPLQPLAQLKEGSVLQVLALGSTALSQAHSR